MEGLNSEWKIEERGRLKNVGKKRERRGGRLVCVCAEEERQAGKELHTMQRMIAIVQQCNFEHNI